jgi:hypothetical protein
MGQIDFTHATDAEQSEDMKAAGKNASGSKRTLFFSDVLTRVNGSAKNPRLAAFIHFQQEAGFYATS